MILTPCVQLPNVDSVLEVPQLQLSQSKVIVGLPALLARKLYVIPQQRVSYVSSQGY